MSRIESARLVLRPLVAADEDDLLAYQSDPSVVRYIPWPVRSREAVREALARVVLRTRLLESGDHISLAIALRENAKVIGQCNLGIVSREDKHAEFGYVVNPAFAGRGFATEAARALLDYAFATVDAHRITARIDSRNLASAAVATKLGMRREAAFVEDEFFKGEWTSTWIYAVLRTEWYATRDPHVAP